MSVLSNLARHVVVSQLQVALGPTLKWHQSPEEAANELAGLPESYAPYYRRSDSENNRLCLVQNEEGDISHYVWGFDVGLEEEPLSALAQPILPKHCVSAPTPAIALMQSFANEPQGNRWRLVLDSTGITGFVSSGDLLRPELRVCVLALLLDVEQRCAEAVTWEPGDSEVALGKLSEARLEKAKELFLRKHRRAPSLVDPGLVFCTMFADKHKMVASLPSLSDLSKRDLSERFSMMEEMRNSLAHANTDLPDDLELLLKVVSVAEDMIRRLAPPTDRAPIRLVVSND